jgi:hypothetical protein
MRRSLFSVSLVALVCCSTYGSEPSETTVPGRDAGGNPDGSTEASASTSDASSEASFDAGADAGAACGDIGASCGTPSACCSLKCAEDRACATTCLPSGAACDAANLASCCVGFWCNGLGCTACVASGQPAAAPGGIPIAHSCCSRKLVANSGGTCG